MEVTKDNFRQQLLPILKHIADATYITFDLEMSGIATRGRNTGDRTGKPSLQQLYEENREAAEAFQVLQVGITCVEENREKEFYLARPYNFHLSPLSASGVDLKLDRKFSFSSSACDFLDGCGFDFGKVFSTGVPYLSKKEEAELTEEFERRAEKNKKIPDITIPLSDTKALEFYENTRLRLRSWVDDTNSDKDHFLNISSPDSPLTGFQRRLVYQLVRGEFTGLRVFSRNNGDFMQVENLDERREAEYQKRGFEKFKSHISKQKGLAWIYEALTQGNLDGINPAWFREPHSEDHEAELILKKKEFAAVKAKLAKKTHIIVGHNVFVDLIYLHRTFIGSLPLDVVHFQEDIHSKFPFVIDTKFLGTHVDAQSQGRSTLKDLLTPLKKVNIPWILLEEEHTAYSSANSKEHEAGYDSWMTAELFVKLSVKLYDKIRPKPRAPKRTSSQVMQVNKNLIDMNINKDNKFALLALESPSDDDEEGIANTGGVKLTRTSSSTYSDLLTSQHTNLNNGDTKNDDSGQWMPDITNNFWKPYLNQLRVNASDIGVCNLSEGILQDDSRASGSNE